jgi:hypothetical protein
MAGGFTDTSDHRHGNLSARVVPTSEAQVETQTQALPLVSPASSAPVTQTWVLPTLVASSLLMLGVLMIGLYGSLRGRRK